MMAVSIIQDIITAIIHFIQGQMHNLYCTYYSTYIEQITVHTCKSGTFLECMIVHVTFMHYASCEVSLL